MGPRTMKFVINFVSMEFDVRCSICEYVSTIFEFLSSYDTPQKHLKWFQTIRGLASQDIYINIE